MIGKIIYYICDACRKTTLTDPDLEIVLSGEPQGYDWHICAGCSDAGWFYCKPCQKAHCRECPALIVAKAEAI